MINILKKRSKRDRKTASPREASNVDISRVIPGFAAANDAAASEPSAPVLETPAAQAPEMAKAEDTTITLEQKYERWLARDLMRLTNSWSALQSDITDQARFKQLQLATHNLKGMAATYGYAAISRLAGSLDNLLKAGVWRQNTDLINLHIDACRAAANHAPSTETEIDAVSDAVCKALEGQVDRLTANRRFAS